MGVDSGEGWEQELDARLEAFLARLNPPAWDDRIGGWCRHGVSTLGSG